MEVLYSSCAGLDVHKDTVVACARRMSGRQVLREVRTFSTTTAGLLALGEWLSELECTHVAMESTGVYWKPVWHVLEGCFELVLANAMHIRNIPGRKTDVNDAVWIADLLAHGLIRSSFVPPEPIRDLRDLTRTRKQLIRENTRHVQRIQKVLEDANLKLASVLSDVMGLSGRAMLNAIVAGETDPERLADLAQRGLKSPRSTLVEALRGTVTDHHRFMLKLHLAQIDSLKEVVRQLDNRLEQTLAPMRPVVDRLKTMPGVSDFVAAVIVAEIGTNMEQFPTAGHLLSWAGLCPAQNISAGRRLSNRSRHGCPWLKTTLVQAAWAVTRCKNTYLRAQFVRLKSRRGPKKAIIAVAASILTAAYYMIKNEVTYHDLGADHFDRHDKTRLTRRLVQRLKDLGLNVEVTSAA